MPGGTGIVIARWKKTDYGTCSVTGAGNTIITAPDDSNYSVATFIASGTFVVASASSTNNSFLAFM
jgi:hypothetical protein